MKNLLILIITLFSLNSCGFEVIYKENKLNNEQSYIDELAAIRIKKDRNRLSQLLKNNLYDLLNPQNISTDPKYFLILEISQSISPTFINLTGSSGRNKLTLNIKYTLKNLTDASIIATGNSSVNDNYDVSDNRYGTTIAEEYIQENLTKLAAQDIRNSIVNDLIELRKQD